MPRSFTIVATGDVLAHERLWVQARRDARADEEMNFAPQLSTIEPVVSAADLAICHLETPVALPGGPYVGYPVFAVPPQIVTGLAKTGFDACTTASNHTFDAGASGVDRTLDALDEAGLDHAGSARSASEARQPTLVDVAAGDGGTATVALLSYTYGFNGIPYPNGERWRSPVIDEEVVLADAAAARAAGAEFVVVALHWGTEYVPEPNDDQLRLAPRLLASDDIDLLLGHHAHVVQPVENIDGEWVAYGMGNLMAAHREPDSAKSEGLLLRFTVTETTPGRLTTTAAEFLPLLQTDPMPVGVIDVPAALDGGDAGTASLDRLARALERTVEVVSSRGGADHGLVLLKAR